MADPPQKPEEPGKPPEAWKPVDFMMAFIVVIIGILLILSILKPWLTGVEPSDDRAAMVISIVSALVATVNLYVGAAIQRNRDKK